MSFKEIIYYIIMNASKIDFTFGIVTINGIYLDKIITLIS